MQLNEECTDELILEEIMEEHCEDLNNGANSFGEFTKTQKQDERVKRTSTTKTKRAAAKKLKESAPNEDQAAAKMDGKGSQTEDKEEGERWSPKSMLTEWGRTDDVVTLGNGDRYYFFKLPHKVCKTLCDVMVM